MRIVRRQTAYTLIELLVVCAILGILLVLAIPNFLNAQIRAKISRVHADIKATENALWLFAADESARKANPSDNRTFFYPPWLIELTTPIAYMSSLPNDVMKPGSLIDRFDRPIAPHFEYISDSTFRYKASPKHAFYLIASFGPDQDIDTGMRWPSGGNYWDFDPSNGVVSDGDILCFGGELSDGFRIFRNGKMWLGSAPF